MGMLDLGFYQACVWSLIISDRPGSTQRSSQLGNVYSVLLAPEGGAKLLRAPRQLKRRTGCARSGLLRRYRALACRPIPLHFGSAAERAFARRLRPAGRSPREQSNPDRNSVQGLTSRRQSARRVRVEEPW